MSRLSSSRSVAALTGLLLILAGAGTWPTSAPRHHTARPLGPACLLLSPNVDDDLNLAEARRRLSSRKHARFRRLAGEILDDLGLRRHKIHDALGDWQGSVENSLLVVLDGPADPNTLYCAAASFGLAARQKAVLAFHADPAGPDALVTLELPGQSLDAVRRLLDRHGLRERTLLPTRDGWLAVLLVPARQTFVFGGVLGARLHVQQGRGMLLGDPTRDGASEHYRHIIRAYCAARVGR